MKNLLEDLRFFIGAFFLIIGVLLVFQGAVTEITPGEYNLNLWTGIMFCVFATGALLMSARANKLI